LPSKRFETNPTSIARTSQKQKKSWGAHPSAEIMVSEALVRGAGLKDVVPVLSHSRVETTFRYDHSALDRMRNVAQALEDRIKK